MKKCIVVLVAVAGLAAQQTQPPAQSPGQNPAQAPAPTPAPAKPASTPAAEVEEAPDFGVSVRRFSLGATLSVMVTKPIKNNTVAESTTSPPLDALHATTGASQRLGWGLMAQIALTERFAVAGSWLVRRPGYIRATDMFEGTDNPNTSADDRTHTTIHEDTRARFYDFPVVLRYYGKDRHDPGPRWFIEGGAAIRRIKSIRTHTETVVDDSDTQFGSVAAVPTERRARGVVAGFGVQVIDPVGVRVVPGVRYTYWLDRTFNSLSTISSKHQIEAMISLTF
jgi:hypothetical protein